MLPALLLTYVIFLYYGKSLESVFNDEFSVTAFIEYVWTVSQSGGKNLRFQTKWILVEGLPDSDRYYFVIFFFRFGGP